MNILFASNSITDWGGSTEITVDTDLFDSTHVPFAIRMAGNIPCGMRGQHAAPPGDTVWYHWVQSFPSALTGSHDGGSFYILDEDKNYVCSCSFVNGSPYIVAYGNSTVGGERIFSYTADTLFVHDLMITVNGTEVTTDFYLNGSLVSTATTSNTTAGRGVPRHFVFHFSDAEGDDMVFSEFFASSDSTIGCTMEMLDADGSGNHTDWTGAFANLSDSDPTTGVSTSSANSRQSYTLESYTGGDDIAAFVISGVAAAGNSAPGFFKPFLRSGGANYDAASIALDNSLTQFCYGLSVDPADGTPWTQSKVNNIEIGFMSSSS